MNTTRKEKSSMVTANLSTATMEQAQKLVAGLFPHQVEGVTFLLKRRRAILADDMGLGKSRQSIVAMKQAVPVGPYLIICPASVKWNWEREVHLVLPDAAVTIIAGQTASGFVPDPQSGWVIVNYDILAKHIDALERVFWAGIIFDEAHYIKNHKSQRSRLSRQLVQSAAVVAGEEPVVHALTGTPVMNRPSDLFPLLQLMNHSLGRSFLSFAKRYCDAYETQFGWVTDGASNLDELAVQLTGVLLRRSKDKVLDLPGKVRTWLPVEVKAATALQETREVVKLLLNNQRGVTGGKRLSRGRRATGPQADRLRILALLTKARQKLAVAKVGQTIDLIQNALDQGEKVLVFSCFDESVKKIQAHFEEQAVLLTGATPTAKRQQIVDRFQNEEGVRVFVANILAGGVGLNLTAARQVIFNDLDWVPANHWQAEDRAYRIGQTQTVNVTYVVARGTVDDFVSQLLEAKSALVKSVIEGEALTDLSNGDILKELERLIGSLSPRLADYTSEDLNEELIAAILREAAEQYRSEVSVSGDHALAHPQMPVHRDALLALAAALSGPEAAKFRVVSSSRPGVTYDLKAMSGGDVECSCPGFEYRGMCSHAKQLKRAMNAGASIPPGFTAVISR